MTRRRGRADQAARAALAPLVASGRAICHRCQQPIRPDEPWDAGHLDDLALGGDPAGPVAPEHRGRCNRSAGARLGNQLRRAPLRRTRVGEWLIGHSIFPETPSPNTPRCPVFLPTQQGILTLARPRLISPTA